MIRNLIIGSEGFIGKSLCEYLENKGEQVVRFDIKRNESEDARTAILPLENCDRVYFLAWEVGGAKYLYKKATQLHQMDWNVSLMKNVMSQLQEHKTPFIFASSQLAEEIDTVYGASKRLGEIWTQQLGGACIRFWNIYGAQEETTERSHVVSDFLNQAITTNEIKMLTTGEEKRQFIHIDDACAGLHHVIKNNLNDAVYDLTTFEWSTVKEMAELIGKYTKSKIIPGSIKGSSRNITATMGRPKGWDTKISLEQGIKRMVESALKNIEVTSN